MKQLYHCCYCCQRKTNSDIKSAVSFAAHNYFGGFYMKKLVSSLIACTVVACSLFSCTIYKDDSANAKEKKTKEPTSADLIVGKWKMDDINAEGIDGGGLIFSESGKGSIYEDTSSMLHFVDDGLNVGGTVLSTEYFTEEGDNLTRLAATYNVSQDAIMEINNLTSETIQIGQRLKIPAPGTQASRNYRRPTQSAPAGKTVNHVVQEGDNLTRLAARYNVSQEKIMEANGLTSDNIQTGQVLKIPASGNSASYQPAKPTVKPVQNTQQKPAQQQQKPAQQQQKPAQQQQKPAQQQQKPAQKQATQQKPAQKQATQQKPAQKQATQQKQTQQKPAQKQTQQKPAQQKTQQKPAQQKTQQKSAQQKTQQKPAQQKTQQKPAQKTQQKPAQKTQQKPAQQKSGNNVQIGFISSCNNI